MRLLACYQRFYMNSQTHSILQPAFHSLRESRDDFTTFRSWQKTLGSCKSQYCGLVLIYNTLSHLHRLWYTWQLAWRHTNGFYILFQTSNLFSFANNWIILTNSSWLTNVSRCNFCYSLILLPYDRATKWLSNNSNFMETLMTWQQNFSSWNFTEDLWQPNITLDVTITTWGVLFDHEAD